MNRDNDKEQLAALFGSRYALVLEAARRYAPGASLTYDVAQQTFIVFMEGFEKKKWEWDSDRQLDSLLFGIAKNVARQLWAQEQKKASEPERLVGERFRDYLNAKYREDDPADELAMNRQRILKYCMQKLTSRNRDLLKKHYEDGLTLEEIASRNRVNATAIRQVFCRLRAKLRDCIQTNLENSLIK